MKIGIIGAGFVGRTVAKLAVRAGHQVMISNSRGPQTLFSAGPMLGCEVGTATEAAQFGDVVVVAVPFTAIGQLPVAAIGAKHVIDTVNYYPARDGQVGELERGELGTSQYLSRYLPKAKITKGFNAIQMVKLETDGQPAGSPDRQALPLAGDDPEGKAIVASLYDAFGFDAVDAGPLSEGWRFERGQPSYCVRLTAAQLRTALAQAKHVGS